MRRVVFIATFLILFAATCQGQLVVGDSVGNARNDTQQGLTTAGLLEVPVNDSIDRVVHAYPTFAVEETAWMDNVRVGYDQGFVIASARQLDLNEERLPFSMRINGWGQLRNTISDVKSPNSDVRQFQLKRGRLIFSGHAFNPDFSFYIQLDGRSSSGDDFRLLDYSLRYDLGHSNFGWDAGELEFRVGKYKMPFTLARWGSGKEFEFADRSMSSTFFDVNRSLAWGLHGATELCGKPFSWETAIFNGLVTGGAETGSSGNLDKNLAYSGRLMAYPVGDWGRWEYADYEWHQCPAFRIGAGTAHSKFSSDGSTEFFTLRVVDTGDPLALTMPPAATDYSASLFCVDASIKARGFSFSFEHYFRSITDVKGAPVSNMFDHGFWMQAGYFVVPKSVEIMTRWSRVEGNSGTLGGPNQSSDEIAAGLAWYIRENHAKVVVDFTFLNGAPINSAALDISPGDDGFLLRTQMQFSF